MHVRAWMMVAAALVRGVVGNEVMELGPEAWYKVGMDRARVADLGAAKTAFAAVEPASARSLHALATLSLIDGDITACVSQRRAAKAADPTAIPPLAEMRVPASSLL